MSSTTAFGIGIIVGFLLATIAAVTLWYELSKPPHWKTLMDKDLELNKRRFDGPSTQSLQDKLNSQQGLIQELIQEIHKAHSGSLEECKDRLCKKVVGNY